MRLGAETALGVGALLALQLSTSFAAIGLLSRTSPAAERILREDDAIVAVEQMLAVLGGDGDADDFHQGLAAATREAQGPTEAELVRRIGLRADAALQGDPAARLDVVALSREFSAANRRGMRELDARARFLGRAGAWASALLGVAGFLLSVVVYRRIRARLEHPIVALDAALEGLRQGDLRRRAGVEDGPAETRRIAHNVNLLADRLEEARRREVPAADPTDRRVLVALLDRLPHAAWVLGADGQLLATNAAGMRLWDAAPGAGAPSLRADLAKASQGGGEAPAGWAHTPIPSARAHLWEALPTPAAPGSG